MWWSESWQWAVAVSIASLSLIVAVLNFRRGREWASLKFTVDRPLRVLDRSRLPGFTVRYGDAPVRDPWVASVTLSNDGRLELVRGDFIDLPLVTVRNTAVIVSAEVSLSKTRLVEAQISFTGDRRGIIVDPPILPIGHSVSIKLVIDGDPQPFSVYSTVKRQRLVRYYSGITILTLMSFVPIPMLV